MARSGTSGNDIIQGNENKNTLLGLDGDDTLYGMGNNDMLYGGNGKDLIEGGDGNDQLNGEDGNDSLFGGTGTDSLFGGANDDVLDGGAGADHMEGGSGNDTYYVQGSDTLVEAADGGRDTVIASRSWTLASGFEDLILRGGYDDLNGNGNSGRNYILGNGGDNHLAGRGGNDDLDGSVGFDTLEGGAGNDRLNGGVDFDEDVLIGGDGNDVYVIRSYWDQVVEASGDEAGWADRIEAYSDIHASQTINVELVQLMGTENLNAEGGGGNDEIRGNSGSNTLSGGEGNDALFGGRGDWLQGGAGNDRLQATSGSTLEGGDGDDRYSIILNDGYPTPWIYEAAGGGFDIVEYSSLGGSSSGAISLAENLEQVGFVIDSSQVWYVQGSAGNDNIALGGSTMYVEGGTGDDRIGIYSDAGHTISGGAGNDRLECYAQQDGGTMVGGSGADTFAFLYHAPGFPPIFHPSFIPVVEIMDFRHGEDRFELGSVFSALPEGQLAEAAFCWGDEAHTAEARIVFQEQGMRGNLYYDPDGVGGTEQVLIATLWHANGPYVDHTDFVVT